MTRDRLPDLLAKQRNTAVPTRNFLRNVHVQIARNKKLNDVLAEAEYIRNLVDVLIENIVIVNNLHNNVLSHTNQDIQTELENRTFTISRTAHRIQNKLRGPFSSSEESADDKLKYSVGLFEEDDIPLLDGPGSDAWGLIFDSRGGLFQLPIPGYVKVDILRNTIFGP